MAEVGTENSPKMNKKRKTEFTDRDPIFKSFDRDFKLSLDKCRQWISDMRLVFLKITCANARSVVPFSRATCDTEILKWPTDNNIQFADREVNCMVESVFVDGLDCLDKYFNENKIPTDPSQQTAVSMLLNFFNEDHGPIFEDMTMKSKGEWTIRVAQHLLSKLSVHNSYVIDSDKGYRFGSTCPCPQNDNLVGYTGDTSFGYKYGWHGETDIIIDDIPVIVQEEEVPFETKYSSSTNAVNSLDSSESFSLETEAWLKAQTIIFSHLQARFNKLRLRNSLIPGLAISKKYVLVNFYDFENDVLLTSDDLILINANEKELAYSVVMFLWLTLNYRLFCSGLTDEMKRFKAGFFDVVDMDFFIKNVERPLHIKPSEENSSKPRCSLNPAYRFKPPPVSNEYVDV